MRYEGPMATVELRPVTSDDVEAFFLDQSDPEASAMATLPARDVDAHRAHWARILADPNCTTWAVEADGQLAGNVVSWSAEGTRLVGYWITKRLWGRGIATAALRRFLAIETTRPLHAHVATTNLGSIRVLEKCGFDATADPPVLGDDGVEEIVMVLR